MLAVGVRPLRFFLGSLTRAALLLRWLLVRGLSVQLCVFVGLLKRAALCFSRLGAVRWRRCGPLGVAELGAVGGGVILARRYPDGQRLGVIASHCEPTILRER